MAMIWGFCLKIGGAYVKVKFQNFVIFSLQKTITTFMIYSPVYSRSTTYFYLSVVCILVPSAFNLAAVRLWSDF